MATKEDIWKVADDLDASGHKPTLAAVRKALGGGSFTTISEAMTEWHARRAADNAPRIEPIPASVQQIVSELSLQVWAVALDLAQGRFQSERESWEKIREQLELERNDAAAFADQLTHELESVNQQVADFGKQVSETKKAHAAEIASLRQASDAEHSLAERAEATAVERLEHIDSLKQELANVRKDKDSEITRLTAMLKKGDGKVG